MTRAALIGAVVLIAGLIAVAACSPLGTFNALVPKDGGVLRGARGVAYGPDPRQRLDVYEPAARGAAHPVIVFFYGGSWSSGDRANYGWLARALAARGFVVVVPDYRLVPAILFPEFLKDGAAAVRWARSNAARFGGDGERIVLAGHSAGAYNAAMLALDPQWLGSDRAAVRGFAGLAGPYDFLPLDGPVPVATFSRWPRPEETQPVNYADAGDPPALLLHGAKDDTVYPRNSTALAAALKGAGVDVTLKLYPDLGHVGIVTAFSRPLRGKAPVLADVASFVKRVTAGNSRAP